MSEKTRFPKIYTDVDAYSRKQSKVANHIAFCVHLGIKYGDFIDGGIVVKAGLFGLKETLHSTEDYALAAQKLATEGVQIETYRYVDDGPRLKIFGRGFVNSRQTHDWIKVVANGQEHLHPMRDTRAYEQIQVYPPPHPSQI